MIIHITWFKQSIHTLLFSALILILYSCRDNSELQSLPENYSQPITATISNEDLKAEIESFIREERVPMECTDSIIELTIISESKENVIYEMYYEYNGFNLTDGMILEHPLYTRETPMPKVMCNVLFAKLNHKHVIAIHPIDDNIRVSEGYVWSVLKDVFPKKYDEYYRKGYVKAPDSYLYRVWRLHFKNGKCVERTIIEK